jgi:hypothetical protein
MIGQGRERRLREKDRTWNDRLIQISIRRSTNDEL